VGPGLTNEERLQAYREHRSALLGVAYRMLGSIADAEDMLQETFIRWQQASPADIQSPRAFLVTILTRLCINHLESARVRREQYYGQWLPEPVLTETADSRSAPLIEADESLSIAFLLLLERLTPTERAVFLLREVFDYEYVQIAQMLGQTQANCRQLLRRARKHIGENTPRFGASREQRERLINEFLQAVSGGDVSNLVALLSHDAVLHSDGGGKAPALPRPIVGAEKVARALIHGGRKLVPQNLTICLVEVNGELAVLSYWEGRPFSVFTVDIAAGRVRNLYIVTNPEKLAHLRALEGVVSLGRNS